MVCVPSRGHGGYCYCPLDIKASVASSSMFFAVYKFHLGFVCEYLFISWLPLNTYIHSQELFRLDL